MREELLKRFFEGTATAAELRTEVTSSMRKASQIASIVNIEDMRDEFPVTQQMAVRLCDAVLKNELPPEALATIGFCLMASDKFTFDGDKDPVLADVIADWSCPEINYALTIENVERFRKWLLGLEPYPEKPPLRQSNGLVSATEKKSTKARWRRLNQD